MQLNENDHKKSETAFKQQQKPPNCFVVKLAALRMRTAHCSRSCSQ